MLFPRVKNTVIVGSIADAIRYLCGSDHEQANCPIGRRRLPKINVRRQSVVRPHGQM